jgi:hypothetical protein
LADKPDPVETGEEEADDDGARRERWWRLGIETAIAIGGVITAVTGLYAALHGSGGLT